MRNCLLRGFTLIELIVVMGILAILATIVVIAVNPGRQFAASRNAKRVNDTRAIAQALDQYAAGNNGNAYASITTTPQTIGTSNLDLTSILVPNYLSAIPFDPSSGSAADTKYVVFKDSNERVSVVAVGAEQGRTVGYGATPNLAAQFASSVGEWLTIADNADLSTGDIDFTLAAWFYLDSLPPGGQSRTIAAKTISSANREYLLTVNGGYAQFLTYAGSAIMGNVTATSFGSLSVNTWYFVTAYHDAVNNQVGISVNNATMQTAATTGSPTDNTGTFAIGVDIDVTSASRMDGRIDRVGLWKRVLSSTDRADLYSAGQGLNFDQLSSSVKTNLVAWWDLNEMSGTRSDRVGVNHLTDYNTVTASAGR